jgi:hypothetical protein
MKSAEGLWPAAFLFLTGGLKTEFATVVHAVKQ